MNFKELLKLTEQSRSTADSFRTTGEAMKKERAVSTAPDKKAKDAARKRAERSKQLPRDKRPKEELIREVIAVRTSSGKVQLIFKDSFDPNRHTPLNKDQSLSLEEARAITRNENFEQTRASELLFGKKQEESEKEKESKATQKAAPKQKNADELAKEQGQEQEQPKQEKAKRLSKDEIFNIMSQMPPDQLAGMPPDIRQEYFKGLRNPPANTDFDSLSFETLSNKFGINILSSAPYNQQVLNALVFLAKIKAGASQQEMDTYTAMAPSGLDFTKNAYEQAKKILSQIGDECIQNLVSTIENGMKTTFSEGNVDMECGNYKFKIAAGGEFSLTTDKFDQNSKTFRGMIATAINQALSNPNISKDPKVAEFVSNVKKNSSNFSNLLMSRDSFEQVKNDPELLAKLQTTPVVNDSGQNLGNVVDKDGNLNKWASLEKYQEQITKAAPSLFKNSKNKPSEFVNYFVQSVLKTMYRGDNIKDPNFAPTHLITQNGIFPMTDDYFSEISKTATVSVKPQSSLLSAGNLSNSKSAPAEVLNKFATIVEQEEKKKKPTSNNIFVEKNKVDPVRLALSYIGTNMDFDINASLLPGFTPKDINAIQYNYVTIGKKTIKIPVERTDKITNELVSENVILINELITEALTNNFVLSALVNAHLVTRQEAMSIYTPGVLLENNDLVKQIYRNVCDRVNENPKAMTIVLNAINHTLYEKYVRDYKMEYRNYHGKPKQRKERAERTKARAELIKKGRVKKGDGKDIDHKKPLRSGGSNGLNNLRVRGKSENRSDNGHQKGEKQNKDWN
jgi:hypothetical protein